MASKTNYTLVDRTDLCVKVVNDLMQENVISVDAEGVHLGMYGPMTLMQVGKTNGHVYLFDVQTSPRLFNDGGLKRLLESQKVLKVMHACANDSVALKSQFGVMLAQVFDTQLAHTIVLESEGRKLPSKMKLCDVCQLYSGDTTMLEQKSDIQVQWNKTHGEYWAVRPMTGEMVDYATADVRVLIPEVYQTQKKCLEEKGLWFKFQERVQEELKYRWDEKVRDEMNARMDAIKNSILQDMDQKYRRNKNLDMITEDELQALKRTKIQDITNYPETVQTLKYMLVEREVNELKQEVETQGRDYFPSNSNFNLLLAARDHRDERVQNLTKQMLTKLDNIMKADFEVKYNLTTPIKHISEDEKRFLRRQRPSSEHDPHYHPIVIRLYWLLMDSDMERRMQNFRENPTEFIVSSGEHGKMKFYLSAPGVPFGIKNKARAFLGQLENAGKVARPNRGQRGTCYNRY